MPQFYEPKIKELFVRAPYLNDTDKVLVERAFHFAKKAHATQTRNNGEPYFNHVFAAASNLADLKMDADTISAGMLHDTIEDCDVTYEQLKTEFNEDVAFLVESVTKLSKLKYQGVERHVESLRKFFVAAAQDLRVVIIKLADRLHNISTLEHVRPEKRARIALETIELHARLADRLGIGRLKGELEDFAFPYAFPLEYAQVKKILKERKQDDEKHVEKMFRSLKRRLADEKIPNKVEYRTKHLYSLYLKLKRYDMDINKIYDLIALRVVVKSVDDCYRVLGLMHRVWRPIPGRIKDYIAVPKPNGYQSLHTTIFTGDGSTVEVQIRTEAMHDEAELGVASHLNYKEIGKNKPAILKRNLAWTQQLLEWQKDVKQPDEFMARLKTDFMEQRVFVMTPKGEVVDLPRGASPIDFAYAIHSDVGRHTTGAKVNGKLVTFSTELHNGDIVEIETKEKGAPSRKWLDYVKTADARRHIQHYFEGKKDV